jgi:alpha-acetolactate decarboxylase
MKGVNVPDYHFHFIGSNGELGGHVLECSPGKAVVSWSKMEGFVMEGFPEAGL